MTAALIAAASLALPLDTRWSDCLLLSGLAVAGYRLFLWRMSVGAPWDGWRAALRCLSAAVAGLLAAAALGGYAAGGLLGWWAIAHGDAGPTLALFGGGAVALLLLQRDRPARQAEALLWAILLAGLALALQGAGGDRWAALPCLFSTAVALALAWASWRLGHGSARALMHAQQRSSG